MLKERALSHGVMEGKGAYNQYAKLQANGAALALPLLEKAIKGIELDSGLEPIVIADYGSSQGRNSMIPMRVALRALRKRIGPSRPVLVFHIDQPSNDFNSLFDVLHADPNRYVADEPDVYPAAIGKSFYDKVLPPDTVHVGWSSYAAVWLSRAPARIPDHFIAFRSTSPARAQFEHQAARDWEAFLACRAQELRSGGRLLVVLPGVADNGSSGFESLFDNANAVLEEMVADGVLASEERARMAVLSHPRRRRDLLAPFENSGEFHKLRVEDFAMSEVADSAWDQYERDGDKESLTNKWALFFRSVFVPSLACALNHAPGGEGETHQAFGDELEKRLKRRLERHLAPMNSFVQTILLARTK